MDTSKPPVTQFLGQTATFPLPANTAANPYPAQSPTAVVIVNASNPDLISTTKTQIPPTVQFPLGQTLIRVDWKQPQPLK